MARTCIICGKHASSAEHIFPAALGGRRTNKGIYCAKHNNDYSPLAAILVEQIDLFNARLGVVGDHSKQVRPAELIEEATGRKVHLTQDKLTFAEPQIISQKNEGNRSAVSMTFSSQKEANEWIATQKAQGNNVEITGVKKERYYPSSLHGQMVLGGPEGLRAIGYVAQTFLAHYFPDVARDPSREAIKKYTLCGIGDGFVWWDFEPPAASRQNAFPFGHRIIVGINDADHTAYARVSLFSTLNFAIIFGTVPSQPSHSVMVDIDPLAKSPPKDIIECPFDFAKGVVVRPAVQTESLKNAIHEGKAASLVSDLMRRLTDYERKLAAERILAKLSNAAELDETARYALFASIIDAESQRVLHLMDHFVSEFRQSKEGKLLPSLIAQLDKLVERDATQPNGLSEATTKSLATAKKALVSKMQVDFSSGALTLDRIEMLIGGGQGLCIVGRALTESLI
jgi:hypothetical protein